MLDNTFLLIRGWTETNSGKNNVLEFPLSVSQRHTRINTHIITTMLRTNRLQLLAQRVRRFSNAASLPRVVSRRAWESHKAKHGPQRAPKTEVKEDEKPWPQSVIAVGVGAAAIGIPYLIAWFLALHQPVRGVVAKFIPGLEDVLRRYFGFAEPMPWQDVRNGEPPVYQLEDEDCQFDREREESIEKLAAETTSVRITVSREGGDLAEIKEMKIPGNTPANHKVLAELAGSGDGTVALEFSDLEETDSVGSETTASFASTAATTTTPVTGKGHVYSAWFYQPPPPDESNSISQLSSTQVELSRLEYEVDRLQKELKELNPSRDIDQISQELQEAKSSLRSLRWRNRLGMT